MQASSEKIPKDVRIFDRKDWPPGPWDKEPDVVNEPPMLLLRQNNGAWAALIQFSPDNLATALEVEQELRSVKLFHPRRVEVIEITHSAHHPVFNDYPGHYMGIFYNAIDDIKPAELHWLEELPQHMRSDYLSDISRYVSLAQARLDLDRLLRTLQAHGLVDRKHRSA